MAIRERTCIDFIAIPFWDTKALLYVILFATFQTHFKMFDLALITQERGWAFSKRQLHTFERGKFKPNTFEWKFKPVATFPRFFTSLTWVVCIRRSLAQVEEAFNWSRSAFGSDVKLYNNSAFIFLVVKGQSWWWCSSSERRRNNYSLSCCRSSNQSKLSRLSAITRDAETYLDINIILMICFFFLIIATMIVMTMRL